MLLQDLPEATVLRHGIGLQLNGFLVQLNTCGQGEAEVSQRLLILRQDSQRVLQAIVAKNEASQFRLLEIFGLGEFFL